MKYLLRIAVLPLVLVFALIVMLINVFIFCKSFVLKGGEFVLVPSDRNTIGDVYQLLEKMHNEGTIK